MENKEELQQEKTTQEIQEELLDLGTPSNEDTNVAVEEEKNEIVEDTADTADTVPQNSMDDISNLSSADAVALLVKKAKILVDEANSKCDDVKQTLQNDLKDYEEEKANLKATVVSVNNELMHHLGFQQEKLEELEAQEEGIQYGEEQEALEEIEESIKVLKEEDFEEAPAYEPKTDITPIYVQEPSSGGFGAFLLGLIGGGATFAGMAYFASTKLGIQLDPSKAPSMETCKPIFEYYAKLVQQTDPNIGIGIMGGSALLVFLILYKMKKGSKATKNLEFAKMQLAQAEDFVAKKEEAKAKFEEIDTHLKDAIDTFKLYGVLLNEQNGKLARIMFVEADKIASGDFHEKSIQEMQDTQELISEVKEYIATPLADENGSLSSDIKKALANLKSKVDSVLKRLY